MYTGKGCPDDKTFKKYARGEMLVKEVSDVALHMLGCQNPNCKQRHEDAQESARSWRENALRVGP